MNPTLVNKSFHTHIHEAIVLGPTGNLQETHKLFYLNTCHTLKRRNFTYYFMPDIVIKKVDKWFDKKSREVYRSRLEFINCTKDFVVLQG